MKNLALNVEVIGAVAEAISNSNADTPYEWYM